MIDLTIARWSQRVPALQWPREAALLTGLGEEIPELLRTSRPLAEVHRLDLALFVVFEEAALRVSGALTRRAPDPEALAFAAQQTLDEAHHHEVFRRRLLLCQGERADAEAAIMTPPLRRFIDRCYEVADQGDFIEGLTLVNLVLEGMAYPLYSYEQRYWRPVDPYLAQLIRGAYVDETRHVNYGAHLVRGLLAQDPARRARVRVLCREARDALAEIFQYYIRSFVSLFDAVARRHQDVFAGAEFAPGRLIADTPYEEQIQAIHASISHEHDRLLQQAGLD